MIRKQLQFWSVNDIVQILQFFSIIERELNLKIFRLHNMTEKNFDLTDYSDIVIQCHNFFNHLYRVVDIR